MIKTASPKFLGTLACSVVLLSCQKDTTTVRFDLQALHTHAAQTGEAIEQIVMMVAAPDTRQSVLFELPLNNPAFDIELPSGPSRIFRVQAFTNTSTSGSSDSNADGGAGEGTDTGGSTQTEGLPPPPIEGDSDGGATGGDSDGDALPPEGDRDGDLLAGGDAPEGSLGGDSDTLVNDPLGGGTPPDEPTPLPTLDALPPGPPSYFGEVVVDLPSRVVIELVIPVYPAGDVRGEVRTSDDIKVPEEFRISFERTEPLAGDEARFVALTRADQSFRRPLPIGSYKIMAEFSYEGTTYNQLSPNITIAKGQRLNNLVVFLAADDSCNPSVGLTPDLDEDGHACDVDCNDGDPALNLDDVDRDGFSTCTGDCNDSDPARFPGAPEYAGDGIDSDCDQQEKCYQDLDADGFGTRTLVDSSDFSCSAAGVSTNAWDCKDDDAFANFSDLDGDGTFSCVEDCNDDPADSNAPLMSRERYEICNDGIDNDCDGATDAVDDDCSCPDMDGDGTACNDCNDNPSDPNAIFMNKHDLDGDGYTTCDSMPDCDDSDPDRRPGLPEICGDDIDNDCDEAVDTEDNECPTGCADSDGDGYADSSCGGTDCNDADPSLTPEDKDDDDASSCDGDCDDARFFVNTMWPEHCFDNWDNNCDGNIDHADAQCDFAQFSDNDGDGFAGGDCDDDPETGFFCWYECENLYPDADGDGFGDQNTANPIFTCEDGNFTRDNTDCNDSEGGVHPMADEVCGNSIDDNCDGEIDNRDFDRDGFIASQCGGSDCLDDEPAKFAFDLDQDGVDTCGTGPTFDCREGDPNVSPSSPEVCDGMDNDCDGIIDNLSGTAELDSDSDGVAECQDNCPNLANAPLAISPAPQDIDFEWLAINCGAPETYTFYLNDVAFGPPENRNSGPDACGCSGFAHVVNYNSNNAAGAYATWQGNGLDTLRFDRSQTGDEELFWLAAKVRGGGAMGDYSVCLFGPCFSSGNCYNQNCADCPTTLSQKTLHTEPQQDSDGDGAGDPCDCLLDNPSVFPGAPENCNDGLDTDCDGADDASDSDCPATCSAAVHDTDNDGFFSREPGVCDPPPALEDCDPTTALAHPGIRYEMSAECSDGLDNDCDGLTDAQDDSCPVVDCNQFQSLGMILVNTPFDYLHGQMDTCGDPPPSTTGLCGVTGLTEWIRFGVLDAQEGPSAADRLEICNRSDFDLSFEDFTPGTCTETACVIVVPPQQCQSISMSGDQTLNWAVRSPSTPCPGQGISYDIRYIDDDAPNSGTSGPGGQGVDCSRDADGDTYFACDDCDDDDYDVYPTAPEICDFVDNDCNGIVDDAFTPMFETQNEDFESDPFSAGWTMNVTTGDDWSTATTSAAGPGGPISFGSNFFGVNGNVGPGTNDKSYVVSPVFDITAFSGTTLGVTFNSYTYNENDCIIAGDGPDYERVEISTDGGNNWVPISACDPQTLHRPFDGQVRGLGYDISSFAGGATGLKFRFIFDNVDAISTMNDDGWYIDNLRVYSCDVPL